MADLSDEDKTRVTLQVDHFIEILAIRYGLHPNDVVDAVKWVREHRTLDEKIKASGIVALIGIIVGALVLALWEGLKHFMVNKP